MLNITITFFPNGKRVSHYRDSCHKPSLECYIEKHSKRFCLDKACLNEYNKKVLSKGILAQLGEHLPYKQRVIGSSPIGPIFLVSI